MWNDNNNEYGLRPASITVQLYADGIAVGESVELSVNNSWSYTWTNLQKYSDGMSELIKYTVDEDEVPEYYEKNIEGGLITNTCTYVPIRTSVIVSKYEVVGAEKHAVPGATLQILDTNRNVVVLEDGTVCEWTTDVSSDIVDEYGVAGHMIDNLPAGTYVLHEAAAPEGYATADDLTFVVEHTNDPQYISLIESPLSVKIAKIDAESGMHVVGSELAVFDTHGNIAKDKDGNEIKWTTNGSHHLIKYIPVGTYYLREIQTPIGYQRAKDIEFTVVDSAKTVEKEMKDSRTYGTIELIKRDAITKDPLKNVVFHFISVNEVKDPETGEVLYNAGQILEEIVTDGNGYAKLSNSVPIGTYGDGRFFEVIKYRLVEIAAAEGQYDVSTASYNIEFTYEGDTNPIVTHRLELENNRPVITVTKTGVPETYVGTYDYRRDITVVNNKDEIEYLITVVNSGTAPAYNVIVRDIIPKNTKFVGMENGHNNGYDATNNMVYWTIDQVKVGESVVLRFTVEVDSDEACEIINVAQYALPHMVPTKPEDYLDPRNDDNDWHNTNEVIHQIATIKKSSSIRHGVDEANAPYVPIGTQFTYTITVNTTNTVYGLTVQDVIPRGLVFVDGTATYVLAGTETVKVNHLNVGDGNVLVFPTIDEVPAGISTFSFDVKVANVAEYDRDYYFINKATATIKKFKDSNDNIHLESNTVSNKTIKTNETSEPVLGFESINESIIWSVIAMISAAAMMFFGAYGFVDQKKKRE
jgi:uncharacterized repeat protein (TIGR01451 family)